MMGLGVLAFSANTGLPESSVRCRNSKCKVPNSAKMLLPADAQPQLQLMPLQGEKRKPSVPGKHSQSLRSPRCPSANHTFPSCTPLPQTAALHLSESCTDIEGDLTAHGSKQPLQVLAEGSVAELPQKQHGFYFHCSLQELLVVGTDEAAHFQCFWGRAADSI